MVPLAPQTGDLGAVRAFRDHDLGDGVGIDLLEKLLAALETLAARHAVVIPRLPGPPASPGGSPAARPRRRGSWRSRRRFHPAIVSEKGPRSPPRSTVGARGECRIDHAGAGVSPAPANRFDEENPQSLVVRKNHGPHHS